jgi:hypothetical protein
MPACCTPSGSDEAPVPAAGLLAQAVLVLRWFLDGTRVAQLATDNAIGASTAYRYLHGPGWNPGRSPIKFRIAGPRSPHGAPRPRAWPSARMASAAARTAVRSSARSPRRAGSIATTLLRPLLTAGWRRARLASP